MDKFGTIFPVWSVKIPKATFRALVGNVVQAQSKQNGSCSPSSLVGRNGLSALISSSDLGRILLIQ